MISAYSNHANSLISLSLSLGELESFVLSLSRQAGEMGGCTTAGIISGQCMLDNLIRPKKTRFESDQQTLPSVQARIERICGTRNHHSHMLQNDHLHPSPHTTQIRSIQPLCMSHRFSLSNRRTSQTASPFPSRENP